MTIFVIAVVALIIIVILAYLNEEFSKKLSEKTGVFDSLLKIISIVAIISGGWWTYDNFSVQRRNVPQMAAEQNISHIAPVRLNSSVISDEVILLIVNLKVTNVGNVLAELKDIYIKVEQVLPVHTCNKNTNRLCIDVEKEIIERYNDDIENKSTTFSWPSLKTHYFKEKVTIEPGESDILDIEFALPCNIEVVRVYNAFRIKESASEFSLKFWEKKDESGQYFNLSSYYKLKNNCHG